MEVKFALCLAFLFVILSPAPGTGEETVVGDIQLAAHEGERIRLKATSIDLGTRKLDEPPEWDFVLVNSSGFDLRVDRITLPCKCTSVAISSDEWTSGQCIDVKIKVDRKPADADGFGHTVLVHFKEPGQIDPLRLVCTGRWETPFAVVETVKVDWDRGRNDFVELCKIKTRGDYDPGRLILLASDNVVADWREQRGVNHSTLEVKLVDSCARIMHSVFLRYTGDKPDGNSVLYERVVNLDLRGEQDSFRVFPKLIGTSGVEGDIILRIYNPLLDESNTVAAACITSGDCSVDATSIVRVQPSLYTVAFDPHAIQELGPNMLSLIITTSDGEKSTILLKR